MNFNLYHDGLFLSITLESSVNQMKILTNKTELDINDFQQILKVHNNDYKHKMKLKGYYIGKHDILNKRGRPNNAPNNRIVSNFCQYIADMSTGFFLGKPVAYSTLKEYQSKLDILLEIFRYNDESAHNLELAEEASITGESYEILYTDNDAAIRFKSIPSEEMILVCESTLEENILYAIRHYRVYNFDGATYTEYVEVYDKSSIRYYDYSGTRLTLTDTRPNYFDDVPIIDFPNNKQRRGDFENVISLVVAYNMAQSLSLDDLMDFTDAFLVLKGMGGTDSEDIKKLRNNKVIVLDDPNGSADWLIKNLNDSYIENLKNRLQVDIHKFSNIADMSDSNFVGNSSGIAIKYKLIGLEQIRSRKEREFKKALQRRIELISGMLKTKSKDAIDFRDVEITFTPNIPANNQEQAQIVKELEGVVSKKKLLSLLPFVEDPVAEIEELKREQEESDESLRDEENYDYEEETETGLLAAQID